MTIFINIQGKKQILEALFPYADKVFQIIFNDYDVITNSFWKLEKKDNSNLEKMIWKFDNIDNVSFETIQSRIMKGEGTGAVQSSES